MGVGPQPIPRPKLTAAHMAEALREMGTAEMRQKAAALGAAIRSEPDGVVEAVKLITRSPLVLMEEVQLERQIIEPNDNNDRVYLFFVAGLYDIRDR